MSADQPQGSDGQAHKTGDAQRGAHGPLDRVLQDERVGRGPRPLDHERHVDRAGTDLDLIRLVGEPLRVESQPPHGWPQERVRLGNSEGEDGADERHAKCGDTVEELRHRGPPPTRPDEGQTQHRQQEQRADFRSHGQADHRARQ